MSTLMWASDESLICGSGPGGGANTEGAEKKSSINQELWQACAGPLVNLPAAGTLVYYFPQGHSEQVAASMKQNVDAQIPNYQNLPSKLLCLLHSVILQADPKTDEVYAQMTLKPVPSYDREALLRSDLSLKSNRPQSVSFCKTLTASDTSTHGGFSVPRRAAEIIFPPLDYSMQRPSQELMASDLHGNVWNFRHIYRGQPRRHLLTTGWSLFVSAKRLSAGDSVLFIRDEKQQLLLGIRRANRQSPNLSSSVLSRDSMHMGILAHAAHAASNNSPFTIFFNPWADPSEFVIPLAKYYKAVNCKQVSLGMRFHMMFESQDSGTRRYMGTITGISDCDPVRWKKSQWRNLQVGWDESADGERHNRVSIWEIEPVTAPIFICPPPVFQSKRPRQPGMPGPQEIIACAEHFDTSQETTDIPSYNSVTDFFERTTTSYGVSGSSIIDHHHQDNKDFLGSVSPSFTSPSTSAADNFFFADGRESCGSPNAQLSNTVNGCTSLTRQTAVNELVQGMEVAKQLRLQLNATSSIETRDLMLQIVSSYEKALMILDCSGSIGAQPHDAGVATAVVPGSPRSPNASPPSDGDLDGVVKESQAPPFETSKKRKTVPRWTYQVRVNPENGLEGPHDDGFSWSKYGQKDILGAAFPRSRSYYRCTYRNLEGCLATKKEQRSDEDPYVIEGTYRGRHTCKLARTDPSKPEIQEQRISTITFSELANPQEIIECDDHLDTSQETTVGPSFNSLIHFLKETTTSGRDSISSIIDNHHHRDNKDFRGSFSPSFESPSTSAADDSFGDGYESYGNPDSELNNILHGDGGICVATGAEEELVNCRRLETFNLKTGYLLLLLVPSRSIDLNLRAECLVEVYLPGSNNALVQDLVNLKQLDLSCSSFTRIPDLSRARKLQSLDLHCCNNLIDVSFIQYLTKLEYINLKGCTSLARLPSLMALKLLLSLDLSDCINLRGLPPSLGCLLSLAALDLSNCKRIQNLPKGILRLKSVQTVSISGCSVLMEQASGPDGMLIENQVNPRDHSSSHASDEEELMSYLPVDKYVPQIPLQQPEEERIISKYNSMASKDAAEPSSTTQDLELHKEVLKAYMNMPVEKIHQAIAFYDVQRTVDLLIRRSPDLQESASLHDLTYCLEELQENIPETMSCMHDARISKASIQVKLAHLHSSFVQSMGHYNGLAARLSVISDEEEDLDAEIDRLLAKRRELLD